MLRQYHRQAFTARDRSRPADQLSAAEIWWLSSSLATLVIVLVCGFVIW